MRQKQTAPAPLNIAAGCVLTDASLYGALSNRDVEQMLYAEDLSEGQQFQLGTYTITEAEILQFADQYDPVPIHTDPAAAAAGPFGGLLRVDSTRLRFISA